MKNLIKKILKFYLFWLYSYKFSDCNRTASITLLIVKVFILERSKENGLKEFNLKKKNLKIISHV